MSDEWYRMVSLLRQPTRDLTLYYPASLAAGGCVRSDAMAACGRRAWSSVIRCRTPLSTNPRPSWKVALPAAMASLSRNMFRPNVRPHMKPHPVVVLQAVRAPGDWNARFSAIIRAYRYRVLNRRARPALLAGRVWHVSVPLDATAMHAAHSK